MSAPDTCLIEGVTKEQLIAIIRHLDITLERWHREGSPRGRYAVKNIRNEYASILGISNESADYQ